MYDYYIMLTTVIKFVVFNQNKVLKVFNLNWNKVINCLQWQTVIIVFSPLFKITLKTQKWSAYCIILIDLDCLFSKKKRRK